MRTIRSILWPLLVLVPLGARAADVPISYTVDDKQLKSAVSGTMLTFELYSDAACTNLTHTENVAIDDVRIVSRLKRFGPKFGTKPPKTAEISTTLTGASPSAANYLEVTGTGVAPIGGACQVQSYTASSGGSGGTLVLKDANGTTMGPFHGDYSYGFVVLDDAGTAVLATPQPAGFAQNVNFFFASTDCSGAPLLQVVNSVGGGFLRLTAGVVGTDLYYYPATGSPVTANSQDQTPSLSVDCAYPGALFIPPNRCCCTPPTCFPTPYNVDAGPPSVMDISGFTPPFHVEVE